ncbi:MAG TPA: hypothetical protein VHY31_03765 [Streptosporangiaceae bacterium]|nr:hypothetical protein [Streptosporangiaceae bacterium]
MAAIAISLGFGFGFQPLPAFSLLSLVVTFCALGVYATSGGWAGSTRCGTG